MSKQYKLILTIFGILLVCGLLVVFVFDINCLFLSIFKIPCPGCGLTRAFRAIFEGNITLALKYNFLSIFIFIFLLVSLILFIIDIIKKSNYLEKYIISFKKYYLLIFILVVIAWIINIIKYV